MIDPKAQVIDDVAAAIGRLARYVAVDPRPGARNRRSMHAIQRHDTGTGVKPVQGASARTARAGWTRSPRCR